MCTIMECHREECPWFAPTWKLRYSEGKLNLLASGHLQCIRTFAMPAVVLLCKFIPSPNSASKNLKIERIFLGCYFTFEKIMLSAKWWWEFSIPSLTLKPVIRIVFEASCSILLGIFTRMVNTNREMVSLRRAFSVAKIPFSRSINESRESCHGDALIYPLLPLFIDSCALLDGYWIDSLSTRSYADTINFAHHPSILLFFLKSLHSFAVKMQYKFAFTSGDKSVPRPWEWVLTTWQL